MSKKKKEKLKEEVEFLKAEIRRGVKLRMWENFTEINNLIFKWLTIEKSAEKNTTDLLCPIKFNNFANFKVEWIVWLKEIW